MSGTLDRIADWAAQGRQVAVATVVSTKLSAPRPIGAKMAINELGEVSGAVSGGCVEGAVIEVAERILGGDPPCLLHFGIADEEAWEVGLPCGGEIGVWVQRLFPESPAGQFLALARQGAPVALVTALEREPSLGAQLLVPAEGEPVGSLGRAELDQIAVQLAIDAITHERGGLVGALGAELFIDVSSPPPRLVIVGAIDFAAELAAVAKLLGWRPFVIDPRARFATAERFPAAEQVIVAWPPEGFARLAPLDQATAVVVLTHDPKLDDPALLASLASDAGYVGAMGSRRTDERRRARLLEAGVSPQALERLSSPIGLDLGATTDAETALSIMSEIIALRRGRSGGRLTVAVGPIHEWS